jgi:hypothetical protein
MRFSEPTSIEGGRFVLDKVSASSPCTGTPKADAFGTRSSTLDCVHSQITPRVSRTHEAANRLMFQ